MSNDNEYTTSECPYCKEEILADAIKCKHCGSKLAAAKPSHHGVCPYCKEEIHKEATKCKHCLSNLFTDKVDCGCEHNITTSKLPNNTHPFGDGDFFNSAEASPESELFQSRFSGTLPKCHWRRRRINSPLPGYPAEYLWEYVCRIGNADVVVISRMKGN